MGVYINMEMPENCDDCRLNNGISCYAVPEYTEDGVVGRTEDRPDWCPLVSIQPHGDLIDRNALIADTSFFDGGDWHYGYSAKQIQAAPTIIPADSSKEAANA